MLTTVARDPSRARVAMACVAANLVLVGAVVVEGWVPLAALALLVPVVLAVVRRPQRAILLLAALVPFYGLLLLVPGLPSAVGAWKELLVAATLVATFVAPADARGGPGRSLPAWAPAAAGLVLVGVLSSVAVGGLQALWGLKVSFFYVLATVAVWRCPLDARERDRLVGILMVTGVVTAVYGIAQQAMGATRLHALGYEYNSTIRTTHGLLRSFSTFTTPFPFAYHLMLVLLVGVAHALGEPGRTRSRLFLLATPVLAVGLAVSFVRGAWLGLAVGLAYLGLTRFRVLLLGVPVLAVGLLLLPTDVSVAALQSGSGTERVHAWQDNVSQIMSHPLGVGIGSTNAAAEKVAGGPQNSAVFHPDNEYYKQAYELGVLGLWFVVLLFAAAFLAAHRSVCPPGGEDLLAMATAANVVGAAAASLITVYLDTFPAELYFWLLLGIVASRSWPGGTTTDVDRQFGQSGLDRRSPVR